MTIRTGRQLLPASTIEGTAVQNAAGEDLGEINEIMIDLDQGRIAYAVLSFGGFLGMGERYVSISWDQLRMSRANDARIQGEVSYTREQLRELPTWRQDRNGWVRG